MATLRRTCSFRPATPRDGAFLERVSRAGFGRYSDDPEQSIRRMASDRHAWLELATADEQGVGFYILRRVPLGRPFGPFPHPVVARLDAIAVAPEVRGLGIGREILARAEARARAEGAVVLTLATAITNRRARRLFTSAGFQLLAPLGPFYANGLEALAMAKALLPQ
jgi:ribosomal protein S18 acetylase RimI-like enzyme